MFPPSYNLNAFKIAISRYFIYQTHQAHLFYRRVTVYSWAHAESFSFSRWNKIWLHPETPSPDLKFACRKNKPEIICKELCTINPCSSVGSPEYLRGWSQSQLPHQHCYTYLHTYLQCISGDWYERAILSLLDLEEFKRKELLVMVARQTNT